METATVKGRNTITTGDSNTKGCGKVEIVTNMGSTIAKTGNFAMTAIGRIICTRGKESLITKTVT